MINKEPLDPKRNEPIEDNTKQQEYWNEVGGILSCMSNPPDFKMHPGYIKKLGDTFILIRK